MIYEIISPFFNDRLSIPLLARYLIEKFHFLE